MTVRSLSATLDEVVGDLIERDFEDSDLEVNYVAGFGENVSQCDHGEFIFEHVYRLTVWVGRMGGGEWTVTGTVKMSMVLNGDLDPIDLLVREVCERARFGLVVVESGQDITLTEADEEAEG